MSSQAIQLSLDFSFRNQRRSLKSRVYLRNKISFGIGKIRKKEQNLLTLYFPWKDKEVEIDEGDSNLAYIATDTTALFEKEEKPMQMYVSLLATELKLAHVFDKLSSLSNSRTRLLPHQIESTFFVVNSLKPRFILADEVGLGKTIEAGLIMKELVFRNQYKKVLVVAPSPLLIQWKNELKNKFNEEFEIIKRKNFITNGDKHWRNFKKVITSIDFIKNPAYSEEILKTKWNIVVFDEAHRLRRDYSKVTKAYQFAEKISKKCECLLLLTATPFRGKLEELFYLVHLVDANVLGSYHSFINDYVVGGRNDLREKISKVLLRRRKIEVGGFTKRFAKTVRIELSEQERAFYDETTEYVKREYNLAMNSKNRAIGFVMVVFQKLLDSSVVALLNALQKRKFLIESRMYRLAGLHSDFEEWDPDETENVEDFIAGLEESTAGDLQSIRRELFSLQRLIKLGKSIKEDRKSQKLKETVNRLKKEGHEKFIIFTQFRNTQDYIAEVLSDYKVSLFHGSLTADEKERTIDAFKEETEILICTEAGGEGRNLQFANILFNYDLPWSPLKIEQRIGRIHRFGQKHNVYIFNFASKDTVAERILEVLEHKISLFENSIGGSDALLGSIEDELDFQSGFMQFVSGRKTKKELETELDSKIKLAEKGYQKLNSLVTPKLMDFNLEDYYAHTLEERQYNNSHLEELLLLYQEYFPEKCRSRLQKTDNHYYYIETDGQPQKKLACFDSNLALQNDSLDFIAFGHPIVDDCIEDLILKQPARQKRYVRNVKFRDTIVYIFLVEFLFSMKRTEVFYMRYLHSNHKVESLDNFPDDLREWITGEPHIEEQAPGVQEILEGGFLYSLKALEREIAKTKNKLNKETHTIFKKEEYKVELSGKNHIRHLEEKLMRQEAKAKWEQKTENKSVINRTKNEILKARQDLDFKLKEIRRGSEIQHKINLFQVYYGSF